MSTHLHQVHVYTGARLATLAGPSGYGLVDGVIAIKDQAIDYVGPKNRLPGRFEDAPRTELNGRLVTPGLMDCHTHLVYAGSRANEFEMRLEGKSYEDIALAGGGIISTVKATRAANDTDLFVQTLARLDNLLAEGVSTVEIKSGYGLDIETELRMLGIARRLEEARSVRIKTTFLGAHAVPAGMDADAYIDDICIPALRAAFADGLVDAVDGFCETIGFTPAQITRVFDTAKELGLPVKLHAEQISYLRGAQLAASYQALSADHLEFISEEGIIAMAEAGVVAGILPGAYYFLGETQKPPIESLRLAGVPMAVATDSNPGSSPMTSILLAMNMAATLFDLTPEECLRGATVNAAKALGLPMSGRLAKGMRADLAIWDVEHPAELTYRIGDAPLYQRIFGGAEC
ncbi:MAG: imidazolonepropionase [Hellea sp.]|nr:imidazolonepropionase [Hellea sp.]